MKWYTDWLNNISWSKIIEWDVKHKITTLISIKSLNNNITLKTAVLFTENWWVGQSVTHPETYLYQRQKPIIYLSVSYYHNGGSMRTAHFLWPRRRNARLLIAISGLKGRWHDTEQWKHAFHHILTHKTISLHRILNDLELFLLFLWENLSLWKSVCFQLYFINRIFLEKCFASGLAPHGTSNGRSPILNYTIISVSTNSLLEKTYE